MPPWGRPPGARLRGRGWDPYQSWPQYDDRFEELETEDEALQGFAQKRFASDELRFTGLDLGNARRRMDAYNENEMSDEEDYDRQTGLVRRGETQLLLQEKEDMLVERALERIRRARALGKTNVKLSQAEIDALDRLERSQQPPPRPTPAPKAAPKGKKTAATKTKAIEAKKKSDKSASSSPRRKAIEGRTRGRSTASNKSKKDERDDALVPYPLPPDPRYDYPTGYRSSAPNSRQQSRTNSAQSLRGQPQQSRPPYADPYHQYRYYSNPDIYGPRPPSNGSRVPRPDPSEPDWEPRARSSSSLVAYPIDQLPPQANPGTGRAPRFDPSDPRFASPPTRRIVSGPPAAQHRRPREERSSPDEEQPEVMRYLASSSGSEEEDEEEESDESGQGVQVDVEETRGGGYAIQTRASAARGSPAAGKAVKKRR